MAGNVTLECKIHDIKKVPGSTIQLVSVHFKLGQREWFKPFRLNYDRPISMEEFKHDLIRAGVFPEAEEDFLAFVKEEADKSFSITVPKPEDPEAVVNNQTANVPKNKDT